MTLSRPFAFALIFFACALLSVARGATPYVPPALRPWVPWVLERHPDLACPEIAGVRACVWPGVLRMDLDATGGSFSFDLHTDREVAIPLPGGPGAWPQDVKLNGAAAPVLDQDGVPTLTVPGGPARISGALRWPALPPTLKVPPEIAIVALDIDGARVPWPRLESDGTLRLGAGEGRRAEEERLDVEVSRKVADGVPVVVTTRLTLRASGAGREVDLGRVGLAGTRPVSLSADLPARFGPGGELVVQVRPGTFTVTFESIHDGPVTDLAPPEAGEAWPETETWAVATDDRVRAVNLGGAPSVDPARTTLPEEWRALPAFLLSAGTALHFEELRRGEPQPPPNALTLSRELWLDLDGGGWTVRDVFGGTLYQGWRLDLQAPGQLGHASDHGTDQVVTRGAQGDGVELRQSTVALVAESRVSPRPASLPAVGWSADVQSLRATVHLPPGWTLWAASGVDRVEGALLDRWTLLDLFFVAVLSAAVARLFGWRWAGVALLGLALSRQEGDAPAGLWVLLVVIAALLRVLDTGWPSRLLRVGRVLTILALAVVLLPFALDQVRGGLFPPLAEPWRPAYDDLPEQFAQLNMDANADAGEGSARKVQLLTDEYGSVSGLLGSEDRDGKKGWSKDKSAYLSLQQDPTAVVQTGAGIPAWTWETAQLTWTSPVSAEHPMRLWLVGPGGNLVISLLRVGLLVALALRLAGLLPRVRPPPAVAAAGLLLLLPLGAAAQDIDATQQVDASQQSAASQHAPAAPDLLGELEARLTAPPACAPRCAAVPEARLAVRGETLVVEAEVHAAADTSWPVPGPAATWVPGEVAVDGKVTSALARRPDGFLHLRLSPGVHRVRAEGPLPPLDALTLQLGLVPRRVVWAESPGWTVDGLRADGSVERAVQLSRVVSAAAGAGASSAENLAPWLEVRRTLDLGLPWRARTTVARVGPADQPLSLRVPLLAGEAVTDAGFQVQDGHVLVTLDRDQAESTWLSTLSTTEALALTAPTGVPWTEVWTLSCSPIFTCAAEGPAPIRHTQDTGDGPRWAPEWRPWPGERVNLSVRRPDAAAGQTLTIDAATLVWSPGRRLGTAELTLTVRTSQGGQQPVHLPAEAALQEVRINAEVRPIQPRDGVIPVPLQPGAQTVVLRWQQPTTGGLAGFFGGPVPSVDLGAPAVNARVEVHLSEPRWVLWLFGPAWGPKPLIWSFVVVVLGAAALLARHPWSPLGFASWALLGLGLTQVHPVEALAVAGWLLALGLRGQRPPERPVVFGLLQLGLVGLTLVAAGCLWHAVYTGLLLPPDMAVAGNGSDSDRLAWYVDRVEGAMPQPRVLSLPLWAWRAVMLAWSLWLAVTVVRLAPWAWRSFSAGGLWRTRKAILAPPAAAPTADTPDQTR